MAAPWDGRLVTYLGYGDAAERPATPNIAPGIMALWRSTDTSELSLWADGAWVENITGSGLPDAPSDGTLYGRKDAAWEAVPELDLDSYGTDQGDMLFRGSTVWEVLPAEASSAYGYIMTSMGGATDPAWGTISDALDTWTGGENGELLMRGPTIWESLNVGSAGQVLTTNGPGEPPSWEDPSSDGIPEAPEDGEIYGRKDGDWEIIPEAPPPESAPFTLGWGFSASPEEEDVIIWQYAFAEDVDFAINLAGSVMFTGTPPGAGYNLLVRKNGTPVAVISLMYDETHFINTSGSPVSFTSGDIVSVENVATDTTIKNVSITFKGART